MSNAILSVVAVVLLVGGAIWTESIGAATTASYLIGRKDDGFVMLWHKVAALESQLDELKPRPPT